MNKCLEFERAFQSRQCALCLAPSSGGLCEICYANLPRLPSQCCPLCLLPIMPARICGACLHDPPAWTSATAALRYTFPVDAMIQSLKYRPDQTLVPVLADCLLAAISPAAVLPDFVIPVPVHAARLRQRGFNQALEIGRYLCRQTGSSLLINACSRSRDTLSQTKLPWRERQKNVRGAFVCQQDLTGRHVAIVDDVMTSGATLNELSKVLRHQGAAAISIWVVARAIPRRLT
ncbi:MAG: phosphoribosyltransferase family protein [Nitrosomonas sp.]|nr:phosphoribosyltransferase family protein [Nitrosomonas sp.]